MNRLFARLRHLAARASGGAMYGACVALAGFYGLVTAVTVTCVTTAVAIVCAVLGRK